MIESAELRAEALQREVDRLTNELNRASRQHGYWWRRCEFAEVALEVLRDAANNWGDPQFDAEFKSAIDTAHSTLAERRKAHMDSNYEDMIRNARQTKVLKWAVTAFGGPNGERTPEVISPEERALRFFEEACELYQAVVHFVADGENARGESFYMVRYPALLNRARECLKIMFGKEPGTVPNEIGGVTTTLQALAEVHGVSVSQEERREFERVLSYPPSHWAARWKAKNEQGL